MPEKMTIVDVEDSWLAGKALHEEWRDEFEREFNEPVGRTLLLLFAKMFEELPDDMMDQIMGGVSTDTQDMFHRVMEFLQGRSA